MFDISKRLLYYKRREVQERIIGSCKDREVGIRYGDNGYGKRPDILLYENDILDTVKKGATSFHVSEERWNNPLDLSTEMQKRDMEELRKGWDLVLDIDCPYWFYSKLTTHLFIKSLRQHGITSVSCKFSGNKGFHIGVPFESFPSEINGMPVRNWFPEGPKKIALYLVDYISSNLIRINQQGEIIFDDMHKTTLEKLGEEIGKSRADLVKYVCSDCGKTIQMDQMSKTEFICPKCEMRLFSEDTKVKVCPKCSSFMDRSIHVKKICSCGTKNPPKEVFDPLAIVDVDTILISARHLYRAPFSLHEKSGLASLSINPDLVLKFEKTMAAPDIINVDSSPIFLDTKYSKKGEALKLMAASFDHKKEDISYKKMMEEEVKNKNALKKYDTITHAIPAEFFPPCMVKILDGLEDGKKRSLFVLVNFLFSAGWGPKEAEELLIEWNKKNRPPLKERDVSFQINYTKQKKEKILPPNCREYYQDFNVCMPDAVCNSIKNPLQYAKKRAFSLLRNKKTRATLSEEQKAMRKKFREKLKNMKAKGDTNEAEKKRDQG